MSSNGMKKLYQSLLAGSIGGNDRGLNPGIESVSVVASPASRTGVDDSVFAGTEANAVKASYDAFNRDVETSIVSGVEAGTESINLTKSQRLAGFLGGNFGYVGGYSKKEVESRTIGLKQPSQDSLGENVKFAGLENVYGNSDVISSTDGVLNLGQLGFGKESYDPALNMNAQHFATFINIGLAKQEDLVEMFFPTVVIDPKESGVKAIVKLTSFINEFTRDINDSRDVLSKMDPKPIIKNIFNREILGEDRTKVVPVYRTNFDENLVKTIKRTNTETGEKITTSPYKFGVKNEILKMSQTDAQLARGVQDNTDNLLPQMTLSKVYFKLTMGGQENIFCVDVGRQPGANFGFIGAGHWKDLNLAFRNRPVSMTLGTTGTAQWDGSAQNPGTAFTGGSFTSTPIEDFRVTFLLNINGNANMETGEVEVFGNSMRVTHIYDKAGVEQDLTKGVGKEILAAITAIEFVGYELDAFRANTNLRTKGRMIKVDEYGTYFVAPWRTPFSLTGPITKHTGDECDFDHVQSLVTAMTAASDVHGIMELERFSDALRLRALDPKDVADRYDYSMNGQLVNVYFQDCTMNLSDHVDSLMSHQRMIDVQAAMLNDLRLACLNMLIDSNYLLAYNVLYKGNGSKPKVLIGTDPIIKEFLLFGCEGDVISGVNFDIVVTSTLNPALKDKMYITLTLGSKPGDVSEIQALNFGWRLFSIAVTATINPENRNDATSVRTMVIPRYFHQADLPIMMVYQVKGLPEVIKKVPVLTK